MNALKKGDSSSDRNQFGEPFELKEVDDSVGVFKESILIGIFSCFCAFSATSGMETVVTILSKYFLGWSMAQNAVLFVTSGLGATASYISVTIIAGKRILDDRQILLTGVSLALLNCL